MSLSVLAVLLGATLSRADTTSAPPDAALGRHVPAFTAKAIDAASGKQMDFDSQKVRRPTAYVFVGVTCPATNAYAERFATLQRTYGAKGVDFLFIYPNSNDTSEAKRAFQKDKGFGGRMIDDQGAQIARAFGAQRTSEVFVADKHGTIVYHGAADDSRDANAVHQHYLADALDQLLAGKPIVTASSQVFA